MSKGVLAKGGTLRDWLLAWAAHFREQAAGRGGGEDRQARLTDARIRESEAKARKAEVETAKDLGLLVEVADLEPLLADWAARAVQAVESAGGRIENTIEAEFKVKLEPHHVWEPLRSALRDIAANPLDDAGDADAGGRTLSAPRTGTYG